MTIQEAIELTDQLKPNRFPAEMKIRWLSKLDSQIYLELLATHQPRPTEEFRGYGPDVNQDRALLVPPPYDEDIYIFYLQSAIDRENGETARYNQSITLYNSAWRSFQSSYNRTHLPLSGGAFRI